MQQRILKAGAPAIPRQREAVAGALEQLPILPGGVVSVAVPHVVLLAPTGKCGVEGRFGVKYGHPSTTSLAMNVHAQSELVLFMIATQPFPLRSCSLVLFRQLVDGLSNAAAVGAVGVVSCTYSAHITPEEQEDVLLQEARAGEVGKCVERWW